MAMLLAVSVPTLPETKPLQTYNLDRTASGFNVATWNSVTESMLTH